MKIIPVFNQKGGCGKTTLSMQIAGGLAARGNRVQVIDMDKQQSAYRWGLRKGFNADIFPMAKHPEQLIQHLAKVENDFDYVIIDCPPAIDSEAPWYALSVGDLALIPVVPDLINVEASREAMSLATQACEGVELPGGVIVEGNAELQTLLVINRLEPNVVLQNRMAVQVRNSVAVPAAATALQKRAAYAAGQISGLTVLTAKRGDTEAKKELNKLLDEIEAKLCDQLASKAA